MGCSFLYGQPFYKCPEIQLIKYGYQWLPACIKMNSKQKLMVANWYTVSNRLSIIDTS